MNNHFIKRLWPLIFCAACSHSVQETKTDFLAANIDSSVSPAQNFFLYANGGWIKKTPIPQSESGWDIGNLVQEDIYLRLKKINIDAENEKDTAGSVSQKIGDFWYSSMDTIAINRNGLTPLGPVLERINSVQSIQDLLSVAANLNNIGIEVMFSDNVKQDDRNSEAMVYFLWQGGLGMPNRDYYFNTDSRTGDVRKAYAVYLDKTFRQLGWDSTIAAKKSDAVFRLETGLAKGSRKLADLRDSYRNYNKMKTAALKALTPDFDWPLYLHAIGIAKLDSVIVGQPEFFITLNRQIKSTSLEVWKDYLRFQLVKQSAEFLDSETYNNYFSYRRMLNGAKEPRPRWKRSLDVEQRAMGELLGRLFIREYFNEKAKQRYIDLVEAFRDAYKTRISRLDWMSESTKQKAYEKLAAVGRKVGYPDKWKDFSALKIDRGPYVLNMQRASQWWHTYYANKLGKPVDRSEWWAAPQDYNAWYSASNNEILLPAGIFTVPGKRDEELDDAFVYGYAGASTIGHEMTHGFDDQGRRYDEKGNLKNWWQDEDSVQFVQRTEKIIRQFNEFNPVDTFHVNGGATQGENIADLGGLLLGLDAFRKTEAYKSGTMIGGFTPLQRYFLGYAFGWLGQKRNESLVYQLMNDVHAPAKERVNGPMANIPEFYEAFHVKPGDKMYRPDSLRVSIW